MVTSQRIRVLVLEDGRVEQRLLQHFVESENLPYSLTIVPTIAAGRHALEDADYDVVLADYYLEDGVAIDIFPDASCPVIVVTSAQDRDTAISSLRAGAYDYVLKDSELSYLKALPVSIERAVRHKHNESRINMLSHAVRSTADAIVICQLEGNITFMNSSCERIFGIPESAGVGSHVNVLCGSKEAVETISTCLENPSPEFHGESEGRRADGEVFPISFSFSPVMDDKGVHVASVFLMRDITDEREREKDRLELESRLRQAQKLEAIGVLAGGVAHDFNNILASIIGFTDLAAEDLEPDSQPYKNLMEVRRASNRAKDLVEQILNFGRVEERSMEPVLVQEVVYEVLQLLRFGFSKDVEVVTRLPEYECTVIADYTELEQIILNLCTNAKHAMSKSGGVLEIKVEKLSGSKLRAEVRPYLDIEKDHVLLSVSDTGCGIAPEFQQKIFEPMFTTKKRGEGTGLGLASVKKTLRKLGGAVHLDSVLGQGSTFEIYIPVTQHSLSESSAVSGEPLEVVYGSGRILVVDDEESILRFMSQMLERLGYSATSVSSALDAIDLFAKDPEAFDLIITDQTMPKMTGDELASRVLKLRKDIPLILCSGYSETVSASESARYGFTDYVRKPVGLADLSERISRALTNQRAPKSH
jgi:PAS domain S-box-containing protein